MKKIFCVTIFIFLQIAAGKGLAEERQVVLITGSASGIGKALAIQLIEKEYRVYGADIQVESNRYLQELGGVPLVMDVTRSDQVDAGIKSLIDREGRIDVLVNNAGISKPGAVEDLSDEQMHMQFDVNVFGYARLQRAALPHMREAGSGKVIVVSSQLGVAAMPGMGWYVASKHAVEGLTDSLRMEVEPLGINVITIRPGGTNTNISKAALESLKSVDTSAAYQAMMDKMVERFTSSPSPYNQSAEEVAAVIVSAVEAENPLPVYHTSASVKKVIENDCAQQMKKVQ